MFDEIDDSSNSGFGDALSALTSAAGSAFSSYELAQSGIIAIPPNIAGQPGTYAIQPGSRAQIIQPSQESSMSTLLFLFIAILVAVFAFKKL